MKGKEALMEMLSRHGNFVTSPLFILTRKIMMKNSYDTDPIGVFLGL